MSGDMAYLNGQFLPLAQAQVPVLDRGFLFADGVYEVIPVYGGKPFTLKEHLKRLERSLLELRIANPHSGEQWHALIARLIAENEPGDRLVYLQVTRGVSEKRGHAFPENTAPTVLGLCQALPSHGAKALQDGVAAITQPDLRWGRCDIKSIALLPNILATQAAREQNRNEAILHRNDRVTEGASSNVFIIKAGQAVTTPKGPEILGGITRDLLLELLRGAKIPVQERAPSLSELRAADEIWLTSATRDVLAVTRLDSQPIGGGTPGPLWKLAHALLRERKRRP